MLPKVDYHMHTSLCGHAEGTPEDYVKHAIKIGLEEIGFSDHAPFFSHDDPTVTMSFDQVPEYHKMIEDVREKYKDKIRVKIGIEADFMIGYLDQVKQFLTEYPYDYVYGSVHFINQWAFDDPKHRPDWDTKDTNNVYRAYHELLRMSAECKLFDIMSHVDLVKKFGDRPSEDFTDEVKETAKVFKESGAAIEVNASGLRKPIGEIYPDLESLKIYCAAGVPITFGSDAHRPHEVGMDFDKAFEYAKQAGYKEYLLFKGRKVEQAVEL